MARLKFQKAGLLSPKTLREEIVQDVDQLEFITGTDRMASANSIFPAVDLDAPEENYFSIGGAVGTMQHVPYASESPIGTLGDIDENSVTTKGYKEKMSPEKETDTKLNSEKEILSLYRWAARQLRATTFLTREKVAWRGDEVTDGLIGTTGDSAHPDLPADHVIQPATAYSDHANALPYEDFALASLLLKQTQQGFFDQNIEIEPRMYVTPGIWHDLKMNVDLKDRFSGVEVRGLSGEQVQRLIDSELPNVREVRAQIPRTDADGNFLDDQGNVVEDVDNAVLDNVLEPYDPVADTTRRNIVIGRPGPTAFMPWFGDNMGDFDEPEAPETPDVAFDATRGFGTQTWVGEDPRVTWLKAFQDIGFHLQLPEHWAVIQDI